MDDLPADMVTVRGVRPLAGFVNVLYLGDEFEIARGVRELERFVALVRQFLLPVIKDQLGVSTFSPNRRVQDASQFILKRFVAMTFPHNLDQL